MGERLRDLSEADLLALQVEIDGKIAALRAENKRAGDEVRARAEREQTRARFSGMSAEDLERAAALLREQG